MGDNIWNRQLAVADDVSFSMFSVQVWYYILPMRSALLQHLCSRDYCIACELAFLFHMLDGMDWVCILSLCERHNSELINHIDIALSLSLSYPS